MGTFAVMWILTLVVFLGAAVKYGCQERHGCVSGQGVYVWPDGHQYDGEWENAKKNGYGVEVFPNGDSYKGEWKDDMMDGVGVVKTAIGDSYVGELKAGKMHGRGVYTWSDGRIYEGELQDGRPHGRGVQTLANGLRFEDEWQEGKRLGGGFSMYRHLQQAWDNWRGNTPKVCPDPADLTNGRRLVHGAGPPYLPGTGFISYVCDPGFALVGGMGSQSRRCNDDLEWTGPPPSCVPANTAKDTARLGSDANNDVGQLLLQRAGVGSGDIVHSEVWDTIASLDRLGVKHPAELTTLSMEDMVAAGLTSTQATLLKAADGTPTQTHRTDEADQHPETRSEL